MKLLLRSRVILLAVVISLGLMPATVFAGPPQFPAQTSSGSIGLQGKISTDPPSKAATISSPGNGATFTSIPITVAGLCPGDVLVKVFANNVFVGSTLCIKGSYSIQVSLFSGQNDLVVRVYDALDQAGPDSNVVTVTYSDAQFAQFGTHVNLTSSFAEKGAPPGEQIDWPILITGGNGPYAISIDWGDGTPTDLISQAFSGTINIKHTYKVSGAYRVIVKATDKDGGTAFLQLVGIATGATQSNAKDKSSGTIVRTQVIWWPALAMLPLIAGAFWTGQRHELFTLRRDLEKNRDREGM